MKYFLLVTFCITLNAYAESFQVEAERLAQDLKTSLMKNLSEQIAKDGVVKAIPFCHENVKLIARKSSADRFDKFEFGRTSHKLRNENNRPQDWITPYLKEFSGSFKGDIKKKYILHRTENGKQIYIEPLYVQAQCLACHGQQVSNEIKRKLNQLYPKDQATGFKLNEFRGFIWIKEK